MYEDLDPDDTRRRQAHQEMICKVWLLMEGFDVKELFKHLTKKEK